MELAPGERYVCLEEQYGDQRPDNLRKIERFQDWNWLKQQMIHPYTPQLPRTIRWIELNYTDLKVKARLYTYIVVECNIHLRPLYA